MATPPMVDAITVASATAGITPTTLAATISTLQAVTATSRERAVGAVAAADSTAGAPAAARHHPSVGPPFIAAGTSAPAGPAASSLAAAAVVGTPVATTAGIAGGHPPTGLPARPHHPIGPPFLTASASAPAGPDAGIARPLDAAAVVGTPVGTTAGAIGPWATAVVAGAPVGTAVGAPVWPSFNPPMDGARRCRMPSSQHPSMAF
jgi:hypothetical protein